MSIIEIILIGIALAMDAFAVSICKGVTIRGKEIRFYLIIALYFGVFQMIMPILGYVISSRFTSFISSFSKILSFAILVIIGIQMIKESFSKLEVLNDKLDFKTMSLLAVATSIDAFAVGVTFSIMKVNIIISSILIGIITFIISIIGVYLGVKFKNKYGDKSLLGGGIILILIGIKILL